MTPTFDSLARFAAFIMSVFGADTHLIFRWRFSWTGDQERKRSMGKYAFFTDAEVNGLQDSTCQKLSVARGIAQSPFVITSGLRSQVQNDQLSESVRDSAHLTGNAVDLSCTDSATRFAMLKGLIGAGFTRIGVYQNHLHADDSTTLPPNVCWYSTAP